MIALYRMVTYITDRFGRESAVYHSEPMTMTDTYRACDRACDIRTEYVATGLISEADAKRTRNAVEQVRARWEVCETV